MDTTDVMNALQVDTLKSIAKLAGIPKTIKRKPELIEALNRFLKADPAGFVDRLEPTERNLLAEAVHNQNCVNPFMYSAKYKVECPQPNRYGKDASLIHMLITRERYSPEIEVPGTIAEILRPLLEKPASPQADTVDRIPATLDLTDGHGMAEPTDIRPIHVYCGEQTVFFELRRVLQLVQGGKVRIQPKSGRPTPATERAIANSLATPDFDLELPKKESENDTLKGGPVRAHAWPVLVQQCGWCKLSGETLKLTQDGQRLLQDSSPELFRLGIEGLRADNEFDELQRINHIRGQTGNARQWLTDPSERREAILDGLAEWPVNEWLGFDEAYRFLNACGHLFMVTDNPSSLYFYEQRYGYIGDGDGIDRQYLRALLFECFATLGLIDVAYVYPHFLWPELSGGWGTDMLDFCGRYDGLLYVRLNPLGLYCLSGSDEYTAPPSEKRKLLTVLPNREIAVAGDQRLLPGDVAMLELFAVKKSDHLWRIDQQLILNYVEGGGSLDDISRFLLENASQDIPDTIRVLFEDLNAKSGAVTNIQDAFLIEFQHAAVAALVAHDSKAGNLCLLAGERHVAVAKKNERAFRTAVKKLGYVLPQ